MQAKTLLAVFAIVIAIGFVAANNIIPQASAQQVVCRGEVHNGGCPPIQASNPVTPPTQASTAADPFGPGGRCANGGAECGVCVSC